jgi:preprotein translocase subunit SecE
MSFIKSEDSNKWITGLVAFFSVIAGFVSTKFVDQLSVWFDLEAKISNISTLSQLLGVLVGIAVFVYIKKSNLTASYLDEVFSEMVKVVWPTREATVKITIGLVVALVIVAAIFVSVDFIFKSILNLIY